MDSTLHYTPPKIAKDFSRRIRSSVFSLKDSDTTSVLELLYMAYADIQGRDSKDIDTGFIQLDALLTKLSLDENNAVFEIVCNLCDAYEERAFMDAIQIGAYLMMELQGEQLKSTCYFDKNSG